MKGLVFTSEMLEKAVYNFEDLDGKNVTLRVAKSGEYGVLVAVEGKHLYLIHQWEDK
jgi:predicted RNA-binding protein (virulence factor B family)